MTVQDIAVGNGPKAQKNSKITFQFECQLEAGNEVVMSSGDKQFEIILGNRNNLQAWNIRLKGVSKGSKRRVVCPSKTAYGTIGCPPYIPADASLIYTFDIISVVLQNKKK